MNSSSSFGITQLAITTVTNGTKEMPEQEYVPYSERPETYIMPIIMIFILVVGITGNGLLAYTILRHANMRSIPNTYVLSLAIGDLMARNTFWFIFALCLSPSSAKPLELADARVRCVSCELYIID